MTGEDAGAQRPQPQDEKRDQHDPRAFMDVVQRLLIGPRLAMEGHDQQTPGIKRGQESGEDSEAEGIAADRGPGRPGRRQDHVLRIVAGEDGNAGYYSKDMILSAS